MKVAEEIGFLMTVVIGTVPLLSGQAPAHHIDLDHYRCVNAPCGDSSQNCWGTGHPWQGTTCSYCNGEAEPDHCTKSHNRKCYYIDQNWPCGKLVVGGTCMGGPVGRCSGGRLTQTNCSVPMCFFRATD